MMNKPTHSKQMEQFLKKSRFLKFHGRTILYILNSNSFWQSLKRRIDFLFYISAIKNGVNILPKEHYWLESEAIFMLVESDISNSHLNFKEIIIDELFRYFVSYLKDELQLEEHFNYEFFCAPYGSEDVYHIYNHGQGWLEQLTIDLFKDPLTQLIKEITKKVNNLESTVIVIMKRT
jgi:hypothetical protein